jgi:hypothetical protein
VAEQTIDRLKQLDQERASLVSSARTEALARVKQGLAELEALGFSFRLVEGAGGAKGKSMGRSGKGSGKGAVKDAPCSICGFKTAPLHDARAHRGQKRKRPFSAKDLEEKGLRRVRDAA